MFRNIVSLVSLLLLFPGLVLSAWVQVDVERTLSRAEALYFEAKFNEAIQLLSPVNDSLRTQPNRVKDRIATKFQLALANIGLNNAPAAKSFLMEIYALDPDYAFDPQQFSPKVVSLANEAKTEQAVARCRTAQEDARKNLSAGDSAAVIKVLQTMKPRCPDLTAIEPEAAELVFKKGLNEYKQGSLPIAIQSFKETLSLAPKHEMAAQFLELSESKLQVAGDRVLLDWQKNFQARQFQQAGAFYRQMSMFKDPGSVQTLTMMGGEYRKALEPLIESFNQVCSRGDTVKGSEIRGQISELLPDPSFAADLRAKMQQCNPPAPLPVAAAPPAAVPPRVSATDPTSSRECLKMDSQLALVRLKQRVEPTFSPQALSYLQNSQAEIQVRIRIDQSGNVTVTEASGANVLVTNAIRTAVSGWKFAPAVDNEGPRCVQTELPIVISRR
jgi:tetratricopeptide (TPR) repeat protein